MKTKDYFIHQLAMKMPGQQYAVRETFAQKGFTLLERGVTDINGIPVKATENYYESHPRRHNVNHERRIRRALKKNGKEGLFHYCKKFVAPHHHDKLQNIIDATLL
jgi:hypothetical protein